MSEADQQLVAALIDAAVENPAEARRLVAERPDLLRSTYVNGETPLHFMASEGYLSGVALLIKLGAQVDVPNELGDTPLIDVACLGNDQMAELLLAAGANPNAPSDTRDNALHTAVQSGNARLVALLLHYGAAPTYVTEIGENIFDALPDDPEERVQMQAVLDHYGIRLATDEEIAAMEALPPAPEAAEQGAPAAVAPDEPDSTGA